jgi:hypothetical protein
MAWQFAGEVRKFAFSRGDEEAQPSRLDLPVQVDHPAAKSLMALPAVNLLVLRRMST